MQKFQLRGYLGDANAPADEAGNGVIARNIVSAKGILTPFDFRHAVNDRPHTSQALGFLLGKLVKKMKLPMQRNPDLYPNDDNGDTLWHIAQQGVDLSTSREIAFSVVFPTKESALAFSVTLLRFEQKVRCCHYPENTAFPMDVTVYPTMVPSHKAISAFEEELAVEAKPLGGLNDGWEFSVDDKDV